MQTSSGNCLVVHTHTHIYKYSLEGPSKECETLLHLFFKVIFAVTNQNFATNKTNRDVICGLHPASFVWSVRPTSFCCCGGNLTSWPRDGTDDTDEPGHQTANFGAIAFAGSVCVYVGQYGLADLGSSTELPDNGPFGYNFLPAWTLFCFRLTQIQRGGVLIGLDG